MELKKFFFQHLIQINPDLKIVEPKPLKCQRFMCIFL